MAIKADTGIVVTVAESGSQSSADKMLVQTNIGELAAKTDNVIVIYGVIDTSAFYNPDAGNRNIGISVALRKNFPVSTVTAGQTEVFFMNAVSDAPLLDLLLDGDKTPVVNNLDYSGFSNGLTVSAASHRFDITPFDANGVQFAVADIDLTGSAGDGVLLLPSGFVDVTKNKNGPALELMAVFSDGTVESFELDYNRISDISYSRHVQPLLNSYCISCHGPQTAETGLRLDSWEELIKGSDFGEAVVPFDAEISQMANMLTLLETGPHPGELAADTLGTVKTDFLIRWISEGAKNDAGNVPYENSVNKLFVTAQAAAEIYVIDADAKVVIRRIKLSDYGYLTTAKPHHVVIEPDGLAFYVSLIGGNRILKFNDRYELINTSVEITIPALLALNSAEEILYVSRFMDFNNPLNSIIALKTSTLGPAGGIVEGQIPVLFQIPHAMAIDHSGRFVYTASLSENKLIPISTSRHVAAAFIELGASQGPLQMTISPDDSEMYLSCQISDQMLVIDISDSNNVHVVDSVSVGVQPFHPSYTPDGGRVYVGNFGENTVTAIDAAGRTVLATISGNGLSQPHGIAASKNGYVFISNRNTNGGYLPRNDFGINAEEGGIGTVVVINTATNQIEKVLEVGQMATGMAIYEP